MTFMKFLGILVALLIILFGIALIYFDLKNKNRKKIALSDDLKEKDGVPVVPRHLRKFSERTKDAEEETPRLNVGRTGKVIPINAGTADSIHTEFATNTSTLQAGDTHIKTPEAATIEINDSLHHNYDIPPVSIQSNSGSSITSTITSSAAALPSITESTSQEQISSDVDIDLDTDVDIDTDINFDSSFTSGFGTQEHIDNTQIDSTNITEQTQMVDNLVHVEPTSHTLHYTSGYRSQESLEDDEYSLVAEKISSLDNEEDAFSSLAAAAESLDPHYQPPISDESDVINAESKEALEPQHIVQDSDIIQDTDIAHEEVIEQTHQHEAAQQSMPSSVSVATDATDLTAPVESDNSHFDPTAIEINMNADDDTQDVMIDSSNNQVISAAIVPEVSSIEDRIVQSQFANESKVLNEHLEQTDVDDQNSPLTNASDNINISILPVNEFSYISGEKLLQLVDDFGFKFGSMNMFHRYQNKDGTGILWFSMMGLTNEGIVPFDLNTLPTTMNLKGLVMFLPLPHPKVLQGFDSMMSIAGLLAREVNGHIVDEYGDEMTAEYKKKLRNIIQSTLVD